MLLEPRSVATSITIVVPHFPFIRGRYLGTFYVDIALDRPFRMGFGVCVVHSLLVSAPLVPQQTLHPEATDETSTHACLG